MLREHFADLGNEKLIKLETLADLYKKHNQDINVISRRDIDNVIEHHIIPALLISRVWKIDDGQEIVDIGTGGGLPGLPLAICFPRNKFRLIDGIGKKIRLVDELVSELGLTNVIAQQKRSEEMEERFDIAIGRGVKDPGSFGSIAGKILKTGPGKRIYYLSGPDQDNGYEQIELDSLIKNNYYKDKFIHIL